MQDNSVSFSWNLDGLEVAGCNPPPTNVPLACGIHIHVGKTCSNQAEVGDHYYSTADDPWNLVTYSTLGTLLGGYSIGQKIVDIGEPDIQGRAVVVHDSDGGRVGCALISADEMVRVLHKPDIMHKPDAILLI